MTHRLSFAKLTLEEGVQLTSNVYIIIDYSHVDCVSDSSHIVLLGSGRIVNTFPQCVIALSAVGSVLTVDGVTALVMTPHHHNRTLALAAAITSPQHALIDHLIDIIYIAGSSIHS